MEHSQTILIIDDGFLGSCFANYIADKYSNERIVILSDSFSSNVVLVEKIQNKVEDVVYKYNTDVVVDFLGIKFNRQDVVKRYMSTSACSDPDILFKFSRFYGPGQPDNLFLSAIIRQALKQDFLSVSDSDKKHDWVYMMDCCSAVDRVLRFGKVYEVYDVCSGFTITDLDVARAVFKKQQLMMSLIDVAENVILLQQDDDFDNRKLKLLGWAPEVDFDVGLSRTIEWFKKKIV